MVKFCLVHDHCAREVPWCAGMITASDDLGKAGAVQGEARWRPCSQQVLSLCMLNIAMTGGPDGPPAVRHELGHH